MSIRSAKVAMGPVTIGDPSQHPGASACHDLGVTALDHRLGELEIADDPASWTAAGFTVDDGVAVVGDTRIRLVGADGERGIRLARISGVDGPVDGLPFAPLTADDPVDPTDHPTTVTAIDHLVAVTPDADRTTAALAAAGIEARRTRRFEVDGSTRRQTFFWLGRTILELVGDDNTAPGGGPARLWGLALTAADLDTAAAVLGDHLGDARPAVQPGRHIATVRTDLLGVSVPLALLSPHPATEPTP